MKRWLLNWRGMLLLTILLAVVIGVLLAMKFQVLAGALTSPIFVVVTNVAFNFKTLKEWIEGICQTMKVGWRQMKANQLEGQEKVQRLICLEQQQLNNMNSFFRTHVEFISCKGLSVNPPFIMLRVTFFNLSVFKWSITSWTLNIKYAQDSSEINCNQQKHRLTKQNDTLNVSLERCQPASCDIELKIDDSLAGCIRQAAVDKTRVSYRIPLIWTLEARDKGMGAHDYPDELSYDGVPNMNI